MTQTNIGVCKSLSYSMRLNVFKVIIHTSIGLVSIKPRDICKKKTVVTIIPIVFTSIRLRHEFQTLILSHILDISRTCSYEGFNRFSCTKFRFDNVRTITTILRFKTWKSTKFENYGQVNSKQSNFTPFSGVVLRKP